MRTQFIAVSNGGFGVRGYPNRTGLPPHVAYRSSAKQTSSDEFGSTTLGVILAYLFVASLMVLALEGPCASHAWRFYSALG
jgi:hypothetical protein